MTIHGIFTWHDRALHHITLHYITLRCITLHCITTHSITSHQKNRITSHRITSLTSNFIHHTSHHAAHHITYHITTHTSHHTLHLTSHHKSQITFCSKGSLFTGFWLAWVGKPRFFTHQIASHTDPPRSAVELRSMHNLRRFGQILLQSLAIYRLLASLGGETSVFYAPDCPYWSAPKCRRVASDALFAAFWANSVPKPRYLQAFG